MLDSSKLPGFNQNFLRVTCQIRPGTVQHQPLAYLQLSFINGETIFTSTELFYWNHLWVQKNIQRSLVSCFHHDSMGVDFEYSEVPVGTPPDFVYLQLHFHIIPIRHFSWISWYWINHVDQVYCLCQFRIKLVHLERSNQLRRPNRIALPPLTLFEHWQMYSLMTHKLPSIGW